MADITPPKIAITSNKTAIKAGETALITFALSEAATDFLLSDITVTGGTLSNFAGTGMSYSATFTPNSNSTSQGSVSVGNFKFSDAAGNANEDGAEANNRLTLTIDTIAPTISISSDRTFLASNETPTVYFLLSEPSSNFDISDISVTGGSVSSFKGSGSSYSVVVTPDGTSNCFVSVLAYRFTDAVGNANYGNSSVTSIYNSGAISAATTLVPYDPRNAQVVWTREFGTSGTDVAQALTTSADGSIYVTGYMSGQTSSNRTDAFLTKFTADGEKVWSRILINADFSSYEVALALTTGSDGNVYVGGRIGGYDGNGQNNPAFISKYSPDGTKIWTTLVGSEIFDISRVAIAYGLDGSVYISGSTMRSFDGQTNNGYYDAFVTKLSPDGTKVWTRILGLIGLDYSNALTTGLDGSVYISGRTNGSLDGQPYSGSNDSYGGDAFITKLTPDGTKVWTRLVGTSEGETGFSLATGLDGSIYLCGYTWGSLDGKTPYGTFITKYSPNGTKAWTQMLFTRGGGFVQDSFNSISVGKDGGIYVSGTTGFSLDGQELISGQDAFLTKYNPDGTKEWTRMLGGMGLDAGTGVKVGSDGAIYLTGFTSGSIDGQTNNGGTDSFIIKLASPDTSVPQISVSTNKTTLSVGESASILITLSKPSTNFIQSDITTQGGILSNFQGSGTSYSAVFTPSIEGVNGALVSVSSGKFSDVLGIFNEDGADANNKVSFKVTVPADTTPPTIAVTSNSTSLAASQSTSILFALSKLSTNFSADDVIVAGGTLSNFTGSGATYSALFTPTANSTTKGTISVPSGVFTDAAGNANTDGADNNNSFTFVVDTVIPSIALSTSKNRLIAGELATLSFVLSEASASFTASDVTVTGGTISNFAGSGTTYTATFTLAANSTASGLVSVASGVFTDYAGNANADGSDVNNSITFVINNAPIANAGPQQYVQVGAAVTLNGANSSDPNGDQLSYRWSTVLKPINSASVLTNQASAQPVFVADLVGTYIFSLVVNDGRLDSATSFITVEVSIPNAPPIANAGSNQNVVIGPVTLDGSASSDADGDTLTYKWFLVAKPNNSTATLVSATAKKPTINTDIAGVYVFTLIVSDGCPSSNGLRQMG